MSACWFSTRIAAAALLLTSWAFGQGEPPATPLPLDDAAGAALQSSAIAQQAYWGVHAVELGTGAPLAAKNPDNWFVPASNAKLFSTSLALSRLGPQYTFETVVTAAAAPASGGFISGDIVLRGGGDPTLSGRVYPYRPKTPAGDPLTAINELADMVVQSGVQRIGGDIVGDDTRYRWEPYPEGWSGDDEAWDYGAAISALSVNDNTVKLVIRPGRSAGELARITVQPAVECITILNNVRTAAAGGQRVETRRAPNSTVIELYGGISLRDGAVVRYVAVDDPARFAACLLKDALEKRGVRISGQARARHQWPGSTTARTKAPAKEAGNGVVLARRTSPPLGQIIAAVNKESLNLHAEMLLCEVGFAARGDGSRESAMKEMKAFLATAGIEDSDYSLDDASGLSRLSLVSPRAITRLLTHMYASPHKEAWLGSLAVGGEDGTLEHRFPNGTAGRLRAKTGTLTHISALAGYAESATYGTVAFSILANNYNSSSGGVRAVIDRIVLEILR
jgi:serine-type D-Ala-D-Ala carboxypeptidase/endopeptidase (penicillin-binding protein 4)